MSQVIRRMPFLWLAIGDEAGPDSMRGKIERKFDEMLSNFNKPPLGPPSPQWLGHRCDRDPVKASGLWDQNHVDANYEPAFLDRLEQLVTPMGKA